MKLSHSVGVRFRPAISHARSDKELGSVFQRSTVPSLFIVSSALRRDARALTWTSVDLSGLPISVRVGTFHRISEPWESPVASTVGEMNVAAVTHCRWP